MSWRSSRDIPALLNRPVLLALTGVGLLLVAAALSGWSDDRPSLPGKLLAKEELLTWRAPDEKGYRPLTLSDTRTTFDLRNVGGQPVRILEITSSCGCATPKMEPTTIPPGGTGTVEVQAIPLQVGERLAIVTLKTDSPATPEVVLQLRIVGSRRPPFLLTAVGDLSFVAGAEEASVREIIATTIEVAGSPPKAPLIKTNVQSLVLDSPTLRAEAPYVEAGTVLRDYVVEVRLVASARQGAFTGDVSVVDPWDAEHIEHLRVHGEVLPILSAVPSRILLRVSQSRVDAEIDASLSVASRHPAPDLAIELENDEAPLTISGPRLVGDGQRSVFTIGLKAGVPRDGEYEIRVRERSTDETLSIPVAVRVEARP